jgi:hypothetical protein
MKTPLSFLLVLIPFLMVNLHGQPLGLSPSKVAPAARQHFAEAHPGQKVLWQRGEKGRFEAFYFVEGIRHTDVYAADGTLLIQKTAILQSQTPANVAEAVNKAYPSAEWTEVNNMVTAAGKKLVEVNLHHLGKEYRLNYDLQGKLHSGGQRDAANTVADN